MSVLSAGIYYCIMTAGAKVRLPLGWIKSYQALKHAGRVCSHYGISPFTLPKWYKGYELLGQDGLKDNSSKAKTSPLQKRSAADENLILALRKERSLGGRRIQSELRRL
jgi:hypothetical protein